MMLTKEPATPDFSTPVEIAPAKLNDFCRRFELARVNLSEIEPISQQDSSGHKLVGIRIGCDAFHTSPRFIKSLMIMFGFTDNIFNYFSPSELFARIIDRHQDKAVQLCFDQKDKAVMAATQSDNQLFPLAKVIDAVQQNEKLLRARYRPKNGVVETFIEQPNQWHSKADSAYQGRFRFTTPVDCWGDSKIALGMVREVCTNGAVVTKDIFTSKVIVEKENGTHLRQLLETFRNDRAFAAMQKRLNDARYIKVSAAEYFKATQLFILHGGDNALKIVERMEDFANYPEQFYHCESFDKIPPARRKDLPVDLSLLNLLNMVSEVMTHHQKEDDGELENFYTTLMTKPADLEGIYTIRQPVKELFFNDLKQSA